MKYTIIILLTSAFIISGCVKNKSTSLYKKNNIRSVNIDTSEEIDTVLLSDIITSIDGYSLELCADSEIGTISKVKIFKDILFVFDKIYAKKVLAFDLKNNGKYLFSIGKKGKGPDEFIKISDFSIDESKKQILVTDVSRKRISFFDLEGKFINQSKLKFNPINVECDEKYYYFLKMIEGDNDFGIVVLDKNFNLINNLFPSNIHPVYSYNKQCFLKYDNKIKINYPSCNKIYEIVGDAIKPELEITNCNLSFSEYVVENKIDQKQIFNHIINSKNSNMLKDIMISCDYFENEKLIKLKYKLNNRSKLLFLLKNREDTLKRIFLKNDFSRVGLNFSNYYNQYGTVGYINSETVSKYKGNFNLFSKYKEKFSIQLIESINNSTPDKNPIIIFIK